MKAKLKAIWMLLTCKGCWLVVKNNDGVVKRMHSGLSMGDAELIRRDINRIMSDEMDCIDAVNEVARIVNGQE